MFSHLINKKHFLIFYLIIACWNLIIYSPSLFHVAELDQITYLAETTQTPDWYSLAMKNYDLNRTRVFCPGDFILFRPLFYFIIGTERYFFGYNFVLWQATGILLHLVVVWLLLRFLWRLHPGPIAFLSTLFFSTLFISKDMVTWHHIHGYLIFCALMIYSIDEFHNYLCNLKQKPIRLFTILVALCMMCFIFEIGNVICLLVFLFLFFQKNHEKINKLIFFIPPIIYSLLSYLNFQFNVNNSHIIGDDHSIQFNAFLPMLINILSSIFWWFAQGFPWLNTQPNFIFLVFIGGFLTFLGFFTQNKNKANTQLIYLLSLVIIITTFFIILGRFHNNDLIYLIKRSYYGYFFWLLFTIIIYLLIDFKKAKHSTLITLSQRSLFVILIFFIATNSFLVLKSNIRIQQIDAPIFNSIYSIEKSRKNNISNVFFHDYPRNSLGNPVVGFLKKHNDPEGKTYSLLEVLYPEIYK